MSDTLSKKAAIWQMILLAIILVGFPLGSWYYLSEGFDYQMTAREQLRKTHKLQSSQLLELQQGKMLEKLEGNMFVLTLLPNSDSVNYSNYAQTFKRLHEQFDAPENIQFWNIFENKDSNFVTDFIALNEIVKDDDQSLFFTAEKENFDQFILQLGFNETELADKEIFPQLVLVDDSLYIRRVFRADVEDEIKQLVEVTALLLPERKKPKARVVRETEK